MSSPDFLHLKIIWPPIGHNFNSTSA